MVDKKQIILHHTEKFNLEKVKEKDGSETVIISGNAQPLNEDSRNGVRYRPDSVKKAYKSLNGVAFLFNHDTNRSLGHVTEVGLTDSHITYKADVDPEEKEYLRKVERKDIQFVSVGCMVENVEFNEDDNIYECDVKEYVELSAVPVPGFANTSATKEDAIFLANELGDTKVLEKLQEASTVAAKLDDEKEAEEKNTIFSEKNEEGLRQRVFDSEDEAIEAEKKLSDAGIKVLRDGKKLVIDDEDVQKAVDILSEADDEDDSDDKDKDKEADDDDEDDSDDKDKDDEEEEATDKDKDDSEDDEESDDEDDDEKDKDKDEAADEEDKETDEEETKESTESDDEDSAEEKLQKAEARIEELFSGFDEMNNRMAILESKVDAMNDAEEDADAETPDEELPAETDEKFEDKKAEAIAKTKTKANQEAKENYPW